MKNREKKVTLGLIAALGLYSTPSLGQEGISELPGSTISLESGERQLVFGAHEVNSALFILKGQENFLSPHSIQQGNDFLDELQALRLGNSNDVKISGSDEESMAIIDEVLGTDFIKDINEPMAAVIFVMGTDVEE